MREAVREWLSDITVELLALTPVGTEDRDPEFANWYADVEATLDTHGFQCIGHGMGRIVATPHLDVDLGVSATEYDHDFEDSIVVKFARRSGSDSSSQDGYEQNKAEAGLWEAVTGDSPPVRYDAAHNVTEPLTPDLFAPVRATAADYGWGLTTGYAPLDAAYTEYEKPRKAREHVSSCAEAMFLEADIRPDMSPSNVGFRDIPLTDVLAGDIAYPRPETVARTDSWVIIL